MARNAIVLAVLLLISAPARAQVGQVKPVACDPRMALGGNVTFESNSGRFLKPPQGGGTVHRNAVSIVLKLGQAKIAVAIDGDSADASKPNLARLDFTGQGTFDTTHVIPLVTVPRDPSSMGLIHFGPATMEVEYQGRKIPVSIYGEYQKSDYWRFLSLKVGTGLEGQCRFGSKVYPVRILDGNGNLSAGDAVKASDGKRIGRREAGVVLTNSDGQVTCDTLVVDTGDGKFDKSVVKSMYGQPVFLDGKWYDVRLSEDRKTVSAKLLDLPTGQLKIGHDDWRILLTGKDCVLSLAGNQEPVPVPAGQYTIFNYLEQGPADKDGNRAKISSGTRDPVTYKFKTVTIPADTLTTVAIGSPITAELKARHSGKLASFDLKLTDASGAAVDYVRMPSGASPDAPKFEVFDELDKSVYTTSMEYG